MPSDLAGERLQKVMARAGVGSRRAVEDLIRAGRVTVNGVPARLGQRVDPARDDVTLDGVRIPIAPGLVHYLLNKPVGVVSTAQDPQGRRTVVDLVPAEPRVFPVGRLDLDSGGLLVLTNDGDLTNGLTHPRYEVPKTYRVLVAGRPSKAALAALTDGVDLEDGPARAVTVKVIDSAPESTLLEIVMAEGRNREVRRMCAAIGHETQSLFRTAIGPLRDASLRSGEWRPLTSDEVRALYEVAGV